ncbi:hypothetical protein AVEN_169341-1, partial [Araneus ventricosus]
MQINIGCSNLSVTTSQIYANFISQITNIEDPADTLEFWSLNKVIFCEWTEERRKKAFKDWCALVGEHMLEVCTDPLSEICLKADEAA